MKEKASKTNEAEIIKKKKGDGWNVFKKTIGLVVDFVFYPLILISILTSMISITARDSTQVRSIFGYSVVTILTPSMESGGFDVGDVVFLNAKSSSELKPTIIENKGTEDENISQLGDVIAFYKYSTPGLIKSSLNPVVSGEETPEIDENAKIKYSSSIKQKAIKEKKEVIFHRIIAVYMAEDGTYFFETKGDSNNSADTMLVNQHLVVGAYVKVPEFITNSLTFMITPSGMFWIIIVPLAIIVFLQIIELMTIIFDMATEKKVLEGSLPFDSEESIKAKVGKEMSEYNKIYFYDISPKEQKERVKEFLWEEDFEKRKKKEREIKEKVEKSINLYEQGRDKYWKFWIEDARSKRLKSKLTKLQRQANIIVKTKMLYEKV